MRAGAVNISVNELESTVKKALAGLGFPYGADAEGAAMARALECAGLGGVQLLQGELPRLRRHGFPRAMPLVNDAGGAWFDGADVAGVALAPSVVDFAVQHGGSTVRNAGCALQNGESTSHNGGHGLWFAAAALEVARPGLWFTVRWQSARREWRATVDGDAMLLSSRPAADDCAALTVTRHGKIPAPPSGTPHLTAEQHRRRRHRCFAEGIKIPAGDWRRLKKPAALTLVPATAVSRAHGAGGGDAND